jgi:hypothetical protein
MKIAFSQLFNLLYLHRMIEKSRQYICFKKSILVVVYGAEFKSIIVVI